MSTLEHKRLNDGFDKRVPPWRKWGAYVSERAWGTVREDYSENGDAWNFLTHDMARSKAYRWGEDGLAGWCDRYQTLVFSLALWNGKDPILKERLFGLNPYEGNHGEDVKEIYNYLDGTPTHSYMKFFYRYPQREFPYAQLIEENKKRGTKDREYELVDTHIFAENRFFDVFVEFAKADAEDTCIKIEIFNRGPQSAEISVLPQLLFRNTWSWNPQHTFQPEISKGPSTSEYQSLYADPKDLPSPDWVSYDYKLSSFYLSATPAQELLFTNNESNNQRLYHSANRKPHVKDAFHAHVIHKESTVNPAEKGTKAAFHYSALSIPAGGSKVLYLRLSPHLSPISDVEEIVKTRKKEADAFYAAIQAKNSSDEDRSIQRQAWAGLMWSTQYYCYNVKNWLEGDDPQSPPPESRYNIRNMHWEHLRAHDLLIMPDKWEYPWFASWDAMFHCVALGSADLPFAKVQLHHFLHYSYQHPNGQVPAYEWGFCETNPPVQAWGVWRLYNLEKDTNKKSALEFLELAYLKLIYNFGWWINKVDKFGNNVFEGGFLGLDNISIIDRSKPLDGGGYFEQSDGTGWMGFYALTMMRMSLELAQLHPLFERMASLFFENFLQIAFAMEGTKRRPVDLWDEEDGFFYDVACDSKGMHHILKVRSFVGLIPLFSFDFFEEEELQNYRHFYAHFKLFTQHHPKLADKCITHQEVNGKKRILFSLMTLPQMKRVLSRVADPEEFLSPYGLRSLSKYHAAHPLEFHSHSVGYEPGESLERMKGGNSNWRGPIWFPTNYLFLESLKRLSTALEGDFSIPLHGKSLPIEELIHSIQNGLVSLFRHDEKGVRPIFHDSGNLGSDPLWKDLLYFYEHYHADTGRGLGASHQTGWSALVANLMAPPRAFV